MTEIRNDSKRGCGWRKPGGLYLIGGKPMSPCGKLPILLDVCPCCHAGIKPTRGFTWVTSQLIESAHCNLGHDCKGCVPFDGSVKRFGLLWIGGSFYKDTATFMIEAQKQGISRRIPALPREFKLGETWILLAHREAIINAYYDASDPLSIARFPGIFSAFMPEAVEYITTGQETPEELEAFVKRGITPVTIERNE